VSLPPPPPSRRLLVLPALALSLVLALALWRARPPGPLPASAPPESFAAARAFVHVEATCRRPHPAGSAENARVRTYLGGALSELGLVPEIHVGMPYPVRVFNVVARLPGRDSTGTVLLVAHYDTHPRAPGAGDDGLAVAAILETLRALSAGPPLRNDLLVLLTDGEEKGLLGAAAFVRDHPALGDVRVVLNFEGRGNAGACLMFETSPRPARLIEVYAGAAPRPAANSLMAEVYRRMPNDTDFTVFLRAGKPGLNFAHVEGYTAYHMPSDRPEGASLATLQDHGETMLALVRAFGARDLGDLAGEDLVWFDLLGLVLVRYPAAWIWPTTASALLLFAALFLRGRRRGRVSLGGLALGLGALFLAILVASALGWAVGHAVLRLFPQAVSTPARGTAGDLAFHAATVLFASSALAWTVCAAARRVGFPSATAGPLLLSALLLLGASVAVPGGSFYLLFPFVAATLAWALRLRATSPTAPAVLAATVAGAVAILVAAPMVQRLYAAMALERAYVSTAVATFSATAIVPALEPLLLAAPWATYRATAFLGALLLSAGLFAL
jgi:hypothetical protein